MRLFLSSYQAGAHNKELLKILGDNNEVAVITNAKDYKSPEERHEKVQETLDFFKSINLKATEIDLRPFFDKQGAKEELAKYNFIWLAGGNVFLLRRALNYAGIDKFLVSKTRNNSIIYGGESAGAIIAGPTLKESEMESDEDSPSFVAEGYRKDVIWSGLGLVNYVPVPHYQSGEYASEIKNYIDRLNEASIPHKDMTNNQAIVIDGNKEEFLK